MLTLNDANARTQPSFEDPDCHQSSAVLDQQVCVVSKCYSK